MPGFVCFFVIIFVTTVCMDLHLIINTVLSWYIYFITVWKMVIMVIIKSIYMVYTIPL